MNHCVKLLTDEDGMPEEPEWHYVISDDGSNRALCSGQVFGPGEGVAAYEDKRVKRGGITCPLCLASIKHFKAIKL